MPNAKITLIGTGFTLTGNYINWGNHLNAIRDLSSPDGKTLTFPALQMQCPQKTCLVSVTNENGTSNLVAFNLTHRPAKKIRKGPPTVKILTPNGGERFIFGKDRINITWSGGRNSVVLMVMQRDPWPYNEQNDFNYWLDWYIIAKDKPPSGSFEWDGKVCSWFDANDCRQVYHGFQKILALSEDKPNEQLTYETLWDPDHNNWDESDNPYLVVTPATISSLEVTSPNGEEKWIQEKSEYPSSLADIGTRAPFEWTTTGFASNGYSVPYYPTLSGQIYSVNLLKGGKFYKTMFSGFIYQYPKWSSFFYYFTFPHYVQNASDYSVEVVFHGLNGDVKDDSNNVFTIGTPPGVVAVRGRMVDRFTKSDLLPDGYFPGYSPNSFVHTGTRKDGTKFYPLYGSLFVFGMGTDDLSLATQKAQYSSYDHISNLPITIAKKPDNAFEAVIDVMDENPQPQRFNVVESDANLLTVPMWTAASLYLSTDVPVSYSVEYVKDGLTLNGSSETALKSSSPWTNYYYGLQYSYYLGRAIPLNYDTKVKLIDNTGKAYYSPNINLGLEYTNYWATLIFKNGTLKWDILPNVQVVYPNGGELLKTGTTQEIKWKYVNAPANYNPRVNIYLAGGASYLGSDYLYYYTAFSPWKLITTTQGTSYNWTIPSDTAASNYRILVRGEPYYSTNYIRDYSDNWFWISYS